MAEYDNTNRGALFKGKKVQDTHPDYEGTINVAGTEYWINAYLKQSKAGATFMSLSVKPKQKQVPPKDERDRATDSIANMADDLPF